ncbi:MAG: hypothetical protein IKM06_04795, partial [Clostridia bacterium]|nr:hypothetical protein [Clostridia bacterium]
AFYEKEIEQRKAMWYPPFARIIRILYVSEDAEKAYNDSLSAYDKIRPLLQELGDNVLYSERSQAPIGRLQEMYRHQILIKLKEFDGIDNTVDKLFDRINGIAQKDLYCDIQINPVNLF